MTFQPQSRLDGKVAVIAGGFGAIGWATAERLAALGARCVLLHRPGSSGVDRVQSLPGQGHQALAADLLDGASLKAAAAQVRESIGRCDILVNSGGFTQPVPAADLEALTDELIDEMFVSNWRGTFAAIRAFAPQLKESEDGLIVNVSSIAGTTGLGSNLAYAASKAGIDALTKGLAKTLAPQIRVLAVSPGVVDSGFVAGRGADFNAKTGATIPLKRVGTADDVAAAIIACCTTMRYATGSIFVADGGRSL